MAREHPGKEGEELRDGEVRKDREEESYVAEERDGSRRQTHLCARADAEPIEDAQQYDGPDGSHEGKRLDRRNDDAKVEHPRKTADRGGERVVDEDEHAPQGADPVIHRLGCHRDHSATLREPMYNLRILQREEDEDRRCHEDEEACQTPDVSIEDA